MLIALLNGLMHQQIAGMDKLNGVEAATIEFCRNGLVHPAMADNKSLAQRREGAKKGKKIS